MRWSSPIGGKHHELTACRPEDVPQHEECVGARPVQVFDHDEAGTRRNGQQGADRSEEPVPSGARFGGRRGLREPVGQVRDEASEFAENAWSDVGRRRVFEDSAQHRRERFEVLGGVGLASSPYDQGVSRANFVDELVRERRLPDPGDTAHVGELRDPRDGSAPHILELSKLGGPTDECGAPARPERDRIARER